MYIAQSYLTLFNKIDFQQIAFFLNIVTKKKQHQKDSLHQTSNIKKNSNFKNYCSRNLENRINNLDGIFIQQTCIVVGNQNKKITKYQQTFCNIFNSDLK